VRERFWKHLGSVSKKTDGSEINSKGLKPFSKRRRQNVQQLCRLGDETPSLSLQKRRPSLEGIGGCGWFTEHVLQFFGFLATQRRHLLDQRGFTEVRAVHSADVPIQSFVAADPGLGKVGDLHVAGSGYAFQRRHPCRLQPIRSNPLIRHQQ